MMYNEIERRRDFMGLTMYLYRAKKKMVEDLKHLKEVERDLHKMWEPIVSNEFPNNYYFVDKSKMTDNQRKLVDEMHDEFYVIEQKRIAIHNKLKVITDSSEKHNDDDDAVWFLKRFNTLHKYIVDNFSNGVDGCHEIPLTKDNVVQILNYLNHIVDILSSLTMVLTEDGNYYYYKCEIPDEIKLPLVLIQSDGCFFGKISIYKSFVHETTKSIDIFSLIAREWDDDHVVWYRSF